ncbi:MAG: septal ring lytic transglycosylase RlpA family protein [Rubrivivax sp.]|nr:septal ring lytic transglycosylase RlpA family protein [Rubrivivax sp.]
MSRTCWLVALCAAMLALLSACSTPPRPAAPGSLPTDTQRDGPPADPPADLMSRPDPQPRVEPIRSGGPNKPYEVLGQRYTPLAADATVSETGLASWYGRKFHGKPTASGEIYDMYASTAAHRTMPIPSYALVRNPANGREVVVRVNDRGPFHSERVIDLSYAAAMKLDLLRGVAPVQVRRLTHDDIRTGRWRGETAVARSDGAALAAASPPADASVAAPAAVAAGAPTATPSAVPTAIPTAVPTATTALAPALAVPVAPAIAPPDATAAAAATPPAPPTAAPTRAAEAGTAGYWVQLGAFKQRQGAHELRDLLARELAWLEPWLAIFDDRTLFRLQAGPFATRSEAQGTAERIRGTAALQPLVLQRR